MRTSIGLALAIAVAMGGVGCGGNGLGDVPPAATPTAASASFSPSKATTAAGEAVPELWWRHRMNGGVATPVTVNGIPGTLTVGERLTRVIDGGTQRVTTFNLTITLNDGSGQVTSNASNTSVETLMAGPPSATVSQALHQDQQISAPGMALHLALQMSAMPSMPLVDFGDRVDLDQLPVGHVDEVTVTTTVTGSVTASGPGGTTSMPVNATSTDHNVWTVQEQLPSMTVLGRTYARVVKIVVAASSTNNETGEVATQTNTFWLAAGIGVVKAITNASTSPAPITAELRETNLGL